MSTGNFLVTLGLGGYLLVTGGLGAEPSGTPPVPPVFPDVITDHTARGISLLITEYRGTRATWAEKTFNADRVRAKIVNPTLPGAITDHAERGLSLLITQYRNTREL